MHDTINLLDYGNPSGKEGDEDRVGNADNVLKADDNANIRGPLTRAMASYSPDIVDILSGDGPGGEWERPTLWRTAAIPRSRTVEVASSE